MQNAGHYVALPNRRHVVANFVRRCLTATEVSASMPGDRESLRQQAITMLLDKVEHLIRSAA